MTSEPIDLIRSGLIKLRRRLGPRAPAELDQFNVYEARSQFSRLLKRVARGEEIVIARNGWPIAKIVPIKRPQPTQPGVIRADVLLRPHERLGAR
jgi:prevent-host-death family protein